MTHEMEAFIAKKINEFDPAGLFKHGVPEDEYSGEIKEFIGIIQSDSEKAKDLEFFIESLYGVFRKSFTAMTVNGRVFDGSRIIKSREDFEEMATLLYATLYL